MDLLTFIAEIVTALAWPGAVLLIVLILRRPLIALIPLLRSLKYGDLEIDFEKGLAEAELAAGVELPTKDIQAPKNTIRSELADMALTSPQAAAIEAWRRVENALVTLARSRQIDVAPAVWAMPLVLSAFMLGDGVITQSQHELVLRLKNLRDRAVHTVKFQLSAEEAIRYIDLANRLETTLK